MEDNEINETKIKYRTDKTRCDPDITTYLDNEKYTLGEHEFTPHYNKNDPNIPTEDYLYELYRFMIAYIQDKDTQFDEMIFDNIQKDANKNIQKTISTIRSFGTHEYDYFYNIFSKYGCSNLITCFGNLHHIPNATIYYNNAKLKQIQQDVRGGKYNVILEKNFPVNVNDKNQITQITNAVNDYNNVVAENSEINKQLIELSKKLNETIDENKILQEQNEKLKAIKQEQADIFRTRKTKYGKMRSITSIYSWFIFFHIIVIIVIKNFRLLQTNQNIDLYFILSLLPLTLPFSVVFYILRRTVYRNEILEIEYEHKEVHAEFYSSLLANDINKDNEEIKQFHREVYLNTLLHNPVENIMKKHKNDNEQTNKMLEKIIEILKLNK